MSIIEKYKTEKIDEILGVVRVMLYEIAVEVLK